MTNSRVTEFLIKFMLFGSVFFTNLEVHATSSSRPVVAFPMFPSPPGASTYWIAEHLEQNTIPMQIRGFRSKLPVGEVAKFYEKWFADKRGFAQKPFGESHLMGAKAGKFQLTVQLKVKEGWTIGVLTAALVYEGVVGSEDQILQRAAEIGSGFPRTAETTVISDTISYDPGKINRVIFLKNKISVEVNALFLREEMIKLGWKLNSDKTVEGGTSSVLIFTKGPQEMIVSIAKPDESSETSIVSSQTRSD